jgi:hypothetical protein
MRRAETYSALARAQVSAGHSDQASAAVRQSLARADLPLPWRVRMLAFLAMLERAEGAGWRPECLWGARSLPGL